MSDIFCTFVVDLERKGAMTAEEQKMLNDLVKMNQDLANRIQEQANQIAWLQRQLFKMHFNVCLLLTVIYKIRLRNSQPYFCISTIVVRG